MCFDTELNEIVERLREIGDPRLAARQPPQDRAPGRIGERDQGVVEILGAGCRH